MKKLIVSTILAILIPGVVHAQGTGGALVVNGQSVSLNAPNAATAKLSLSSPHASANIGVFTADVERLQVSGAGSLFLPLSSPAAGTAATTIANSATIDSTIFWQRVTNAGAVTGIIIEAGTAHGQIVLVTVDKDAGGSVTMAAEATSNVCSGTGAVIAAGESAMFIYDLTDTCWSENGL